MILTKIEILYNNYFLQVFIETYFTIFIIKNDNIYNKNVRKGIIFRNKNMKIKLLYVQKTFRYVRFINIKNKLDLYNKTEIITEAMLLIYYDYKFDKYYFRLLFCYMLKLSEPSYVENWTLTSTQ